MTTYAIAYLIHRWVAIGRRHSEVEGKNKRARAEDNMVGGLLSHNRLLSDQHPCHMNRLASRSISDEGLGLVHSRYTRNWNRDVWKRWAVELRNKGWSVCTKICCATQSAINQVACGRGTWVGSTHQYRMQARSCIILQLDCLYITYVDVAGLTWRSFFAHL